MSITLDYSSDTEDRYTVQIHDHFVLTTVTKTTSVVNRWLSDIYRIHRSRLNCLIVGLDVEWRPSFNRRNSNPVATLQLCVGCRCLIFQLIYAREIPYSLIDFLSSSDFTFVGVGIGEDVEKLLEDYELNVARKLDLRTLAVRELGRRDLRQAGLKRLANVVLGEDVEKPRRVTMSRWDAEWLNWEQVQYACIDAYLSFEIARTLIN